jgi:hypothetical protein
VTRPAVFPDRDGVLTELVPDPSTGAFESPLHPEDAALVPGVAAAARQLARPGYLLVGVTNQPAAPADQPAAGPGRARRHGAASRPRNETVADDQR